MKWFDFSDKTFLCLFFLVLAGLLFVFLFVALYSRFAKKASGYRKLLSGESSTLRIYSIDVRNNKVTYFTRSNMHDKKTTDLDSFYFHFHKNDQEKLKQWIFSICVDSKKVDQYIEVDAILEKKRSYFSLLKLIKYDPYAGIIHIEGHVLKYITPAHAYGHRKKHGPLMGVVKQSTIKSIISKEKALKGFTYAIRFFYLKQTVLANDKIERYMVMTLRNEVYPFADNPKAPRQMLENGDNEILLFDNRTASRDEAMLLASSIAHSLNKAIGVNGFTESVSFAIGVVENAQYYQDFETIVSKAQEACISAQQSRQEVLFYQKRAGSLLEREKYEAQVDHLMEPGSLRYLFRPVINAQEGRVIGHFEYVKAYDSPFASFPEMSKYAARVQKNRELFAICARYVIPKFASEKLSVKERLFFSASMLDIEHMQEILPQIPETKDIHLVIVFQEQEINENAKDTELLNAALGKLHAAGYELGLLLKDKNLLLDSSVYTNFDYFVIDSGMLNEIKKNNRIRLSIHALVEALLKYRKPIIASDLEGWQSIELIIKSGLVCISSEAVASSNDMLLPVDKKKMEKLKKLTEDLR